MRLDNRSEMFRILPALLILLISIGFIIYLESGPKYPKNTERFHFSMWTTSKNESCFIPHDAFIEIDLENNSMRFYGYFHRRCNKTNTYLTSDLTPEPQTFALYINDQDASHLPNWTTPSRWRMEIDWAENLTEIQSINKIELRATFQDSLFSNYYRIVGNTFESMQLDLVYVNYKPLFKGYSCEEGCYSIVDGVVTKEHPVMKVGNERLKTFEVSGTDLLFRFNPKSTGYSALETALSAIATGSFLFILLNIFPGRNKSL